MHEHHRGFVYGFFAALCSSAMYVCVKLAPDVPISSFIFFRYLIGLILLAPWFLQEKIELHWQYWPMHLVRDLSGVIGMACFFYALSSLSLVNASTLIGTFPLFIPLICLIWLKKIIPMQSFLALMIGFAGVVAILRPFGQFWQWADAFALTSSILAAVAALTIRKLSHVESTRSILFSYFVLSTLVSAIPMIIFWEPLSISNWFYLALIGIFGALYQFLMTKSYTHAPVSRASMMSYFNVIFGGAFGWLIWAEIPTVWDAAGVVLITLGGALSLFDKGSARNLNK
jgi:drug/metabolite transporter (DMT)-like permease